MTCIFGSFTEITKTLFNTGGALALYFAAAQLATRRRAHLLEIYSMTFEMLDTPEMREARKYVYKMAKEEVPRRAFVDEHWQDLDKHAQDPNFETWRRHRDMAEKVGRSFDQLGLLVREGRIPVDVVARFYASPAIRCWYGLAPYIASERSPDQRNQPGHFWEWEHLVTDVIVEHLTDHHGVWKGVSRHDKLEDWAGKVRHELGSMQRDTEYCPPQRLWELGPWWDVRKW
jgi:hypothetical protein